MKNEMQECLKAAALTAISRFVTWKTNATFEGMVVATMRATGLPRKSVVAACEKKYGRQFSREVL